MRAAAQAPYGWRCPRSDSLAGLRRLFTSVVERERELDSLLANRIAASAREAAAAETGELLDLPSSVLDRFQTGDVSGYLGRRSQRRVVSAVLRRLLRRGMANGHSRNPPLLFHGAGERCSVDNSLSTLGR